METCEYYDRVRNKMGRSYRTVSLKKYENHEKTEDKLF
jgi:hypothetical protein